MVFVVGTCVNREKDLRSRVFFGGRWDWVIDDAALK